MMSIQHLREQAAALSKELNHMLADAGDVIWSAEKQAEFDEKWKNPATATNALLELSGLYAVKVPSTGPADSGAGRPVGGPSPFQTTAEWKVAMRESEAKYGNAMDDPNYAARAVATMKKDPSIMRT